MVLPLLMLIINDLHSGITEVISEEESIQRIRPKKCLKLSHKLSREVIKSETRRKPQRVLVLSSLGRSGSSFLGLILAALGKNMYFFEPIRGVPNECQDKETSTEEIINYFQCRVRSSILDVGSVVSVGIVHPYTLNKTKDQVTLQRVIEHCQQEPLIIIKVIRARLAWIRERMEQKELDNLKIIHLVRDPRGSITSMDNLKWEKTDMELCVQMSQDLQEKEAMMSLYPSRYTFIKYEDLCRDPYGEARRLMHFIHGHGGGKPTVTNTTVFNITRTVDAKNQSRLDPAMYQDLPKGVLDFLKDHVHLYPEKSPSPYSVERNTIQMGEWWRWFINETQLRRIETMCGHVIRTLGHRMFFNISAVRNSSFSLLDDKLS